PTDKTLTMNRHGKLLHKGSFRRVGGKRLDVVRQAQMSGDLARRIMIAGDHEHADARLTQTPHPLTEIKPRVVILPVTVVEITRQQYKGHALSNGKFHQVVKGTARSAA